MAGSSCGGRTFALMVMQVVQFDVVNLERENRRLKRIGALVVVVIAAVVLMGQDMPIRTSESVVAKEFILRDESRKVRGELGIDNHGWPHLGISDKSGKVRDNLTLDALVHENSSENPRATLLVTPDGSPGLALFDKKGNGGVTLSLLTDSLPSLDFSKDGKVLWSVP